MRNILVLMSTYNGEKYLKEQIWIPEGPQQSYQADRGRTGSGNSARYFPLEDQWHE